MLFLRRLRRAEATAACGVEPRLRARRATEADPRQAKDAEGTDGAPLSLFDQFSGQKEVTGQHPEEQSPTSMRSVLMCLNPQCWLVLMTLMPLIGGAELGQQIHQRAGSVAESFQVHVHGCEGATVCGHLTLHANSVGSPARSRSLGMNTGSNPNPPSPSTAGAMRPTHAPRR